MAIANTTDDLLTSVKLACFSPARQTTISDSDILLMATEEMLAIVAPLVKNAHESYFTTQFDYTVGATNGFALPSRAMGAAISQVMLIAADGSLMRLPSVYLGAPETLTGAMNQGYRAVYYLQNNLIMLSPFPITQQTMRLFYYPRPGDLVKYSTSCATVASIGGSSFTISQAIPGLAAVGAFDVIDKNSPYKYKYMDQTGTVATTTITMTPPADMVVGDVISLAQTSGIPQIPYDLHVALRYRTAMRVMEALGDLSGMAQMEKRATEAMQSAMSLIEPRIDSQTRKIIPLTTPFRGGVRTSWYRRY